MNRLNSRRNASLRLGTAARAGLAVAGLAAAAALAGCGTGQIAQTTDQVSAVSGAEGGVGELTLRDVRIQAVQSSGDFLQPGRTVDLVFVATNQSPDATDELTGITTEVGKVSLTGAKKLPPGGVLIVGAPVGQDTAPPTGVKGARGAGEAGGATATLALDKPITNGLTYDFTFDFKNAGKVNLAVPISAEVLSPHR